MDPTCQRLWSTPARTTSWAWKNCRKPTTRHGLESRWIGLAQWAKSGAESRSKMKWNWSRGWYEHAAYRPRCLKLGDEIMLLSCQMKGRFVTLHPLPARKSRNSLQRRKQNSKSLTRKRRVHFALIPLQDRNPQTSCAYISSSWLHFSIPCVQSCKELTIYWQLQGTWEGRCDSLLPSESRP